MPPHLQKEIRQDKRIWPGDSKEVGLRSPATWEESHKVVLEYEQREAAHRAVAHSTYSTTAGEPSDPSAALAKAQKEIRELKAAAKAAAARPSELGRAVKHADQELLANMVRPGAPVEHALDAATQHLDHSPVLVAAGLVLCQRPPVAWQLVERREAAALALLKSTVETSFLSVGEDGPCETCGVSKASEFSDGCFSCGSVDRAAVRSYQGAARAPGLADGGGGVSGVLAAVSALFGGGSCERPVEDPAVVTFLGNSPKENSWWDAPGGVASVWGRRPKADELPTF